MGMGMYILDDDGNVVPEPDALKWGRWYENAPGRVLARTTVVSADEADVETVEVSTVFLGIDHAFGVGPPVLWETMVFGGLLDQEQERYTSREAAEKGHAEMCRRAELAGPGMPEKTVATRNVVEVESHRRLRKKR